MMKCSLVALTVFLSLPACSSSSHSENDAQSPLVDLVESTHIIRELITQNKLASILEPHDSERLTILLKM